MKNSLSQDKWSLLLRYVKRFKYIPFVDFVLVAGSMATGDTHEESDFDLIVGAKENRIFTVRFFSALFFQLDNVRRKNSDTKEQSSDKVCLNHFITPESYRLDPPYNDYWKYLYQNLVPVYGSKDKINEFFKENEWAGNINPSFNKWIGNEKSIIRHSIESPLLEWPVDMLEKIVKKYQIKRIKNNLEDSLGHKPIVVYNDKELRFHMDTKRIEEFLEDKN